MGCEAVSLCRTHLAFLEMLTCLFQRVKREKDPSKIYEFMIPVDAYLSLSFPHNLLSCRQHLVLTSHVVLYYLDGFIFHQFNITPTLGQTFLMQSVNRPLPVLLQIRKLQEES